MQAQSLDPGAIMRALASAMLFAVAAWFAQGLLAARTSPLQRAGATTARQAAEQPQPTSGSDKTTITIPEGTKIVLALTAPVWSKSSKPGDGVYAITAFPVSVNNQMAIPPGTYVEGRVDTIISPTWRTNRGELQMHFTKMIFANNFAIDLSSAAQPAASSLPGLLPAAAEVYVVVSGRSDVLLDNGSQIEMTLQMPLSLDAGQVAAAARLAKPQHVVPVRSATRCVPIPATPGTDPTVIPGTPGTPGTAPIVIPGPPGQPDTVIPGTPATPGTPDTVIGGSSGTPAIPCPGPPVVTSVPDDHDIHTKYLEVASPLRVTGALLAPRRYQLRWTGLGPAAAVQILLKSKVVARVQARVLLLDRKPSADDLKTHANPDGSISLEAVLFAGESFALVFN